MITPFEKYIITQGFSGAHPAIDLASQGNLGIRCGDNGRVFFRYDFKPNEPLFYNGKVWNNTGGNFIVVQMGDLFGYYGHMSAIAVRVGDSVSKGQTLGWQGATGYVTGPHVHWEIRKGGWGLRYPAINPLTLIEEEQPMPSWEEDVKINYVKPAYKELGWNYKPSDIFSEQVKSLIDHCRYLNRENKELKKQLESEYKPIGQLYIKK